MLLRVSPSLPEPRATDAVDTAFGKLAEGELEDGEGLETKVEVELLINENATQVEEVGTVDKIIFSSRCFVFSQAWPSWSFTLNSMGCSDLVTSVEWGCAISRKEFESTELGETLADMGRAKERLKSVKRPLIFIQGSKSFVGKIIQDIGSHPCGLICTTVVYLRLLEQIK